MDAPALSEADAVIDRARGAFLGLAVGDALGTTLEFKPRGSFPHHSEMIGGGPFQLAAGCWTDDTSMALALADSLIECGQLDPTDLMRRFVSWWREGAYSPTGRCFDIGIATREALARFARDGDPIAGSRDSHAAGNGCLMRLSPVAIFHAGDREKALETARLQSSTTHGSRECLDASAYFCGLLVDAIGGAPKDQVLKAWTWDGAPKVASIANRGWHGKARSTIKSTGYVIDSLEAALWCVDATNSFESAVTLAVNLGDDADTIGAITGQLAGAIYGYATIPPRWREPLAWEPRLLAIADALAHRIPAVRRPRLEALATFAGPLSAPDFSPGRWIPARPPQIGYPILSELAERFVRVAYDSGWVRPFDWNEWKTSPEAIGLLNDPETLARASDDQLARLTTAIIRQDRFIDGVLLEEFERGTMGAIAKRAKALLKMLDE